MIRFYQIPLLRLRLLRKRQREYKKKNEGHQENKDLNRISQQDQRKLLWTRKNGGSTLRPAQSVPGLIQWFYEPPMTGMHGALILCLLVALSLLFALSNFTSLACVLTVILLLSLGNLNSNERQKTTGSGWGGQIWGGPRKTRQRENVIRIYYVRKTYIIS